MPVNLEPFLHRFSWVLVFLTPVCGKENRRYVVSGLDVQFFELYSSKQVIVKALIGMAVDWQESHEKNRLKLVATVWANSQNVAPLNRYKIPVTSRMNGDQFHTVVNTLYLLYTVRTCV